MRRTLHRGSETPTVLGRYAETMGRLVERQMATAALIAAKQQAEALAEQAQQAMLEAIASNDTLRGEIQHRMQTQSRLAYLASHDPLTGLSNRALLTERLGGSMVQARRAGTRLALLGLDLDHFKDVNDTLGHAAGDALLKEVAQRLQSCLRAGETVGRMGGDEFAILQGGLADPGGAGALAQRLMAALGPPDRHRGPPLVHRRLDRHYSVSGRRGRSGPVAAQCRLGDVLRQARGPEPVPLLRRGAEPRSDAPRARWSRRCAQPWPTASSRSPTSRRWIWWRTADRRRGAATVGPPGVWPGVARESSSNWPSGAGSSTAWAPGSWARRAGRRCGGTPPG